MRENICVLIPVSQFVFGQFMIVHEFMHTCEILDTLVKDHVQCNFLK